MKGAAVAAMAALALAACGGTGGGKSVAQTGSNRPAETTSSVEPEPDSSEMGSPSEESPDTTEDQDVELKFGETFTWEDGLSVMVGKPVKVSRSEWASGGENSKYILAFPVTLVNKTGKRFDPTGFSSTLQSGNEEGDPVFDTEKGLNDTPTTTLLNGREAKFKLAYGVNSKTDIVLEVSPDFGEHTSVIYTP